MDPTKRVYDPIHHFIELDENEVALIDAAPLQRMRRLRQLGLAYLAFPSAEHSRFSHALGALALGERALVALRRYDADGYFRDERDYLAQRRLLRASLLLHDVGHGPFSHACEAVLGVRHETRTAAILALPEIAAALERLDVDAGEVLDLIAGTGANYPVLRALVSGPNLDADRMDYLLRDAYFTGVVNGRYDSEQLVSSLRVIDVGGRAHLGVDSRGLVALESFVLARYMMFSKIYFHHTTRMFERVLQDALRELWSDPRALDDVERYLAWDDFRVLDAFRAMPSEAATALRDRRKLYGLVLEFNAERDLTAFDACWHALRTRFGDDLWVDEQEQVLHRIPLVSEGSGSPLFVQLRTGVTEAIYASDVIAKLTGKAYWRKLFVRRREPRAVDEAREICRRIVSIGPLLA